MKPQLTAREVQEIALHQTMETGLLEKLLCLSDLARFGPEEDFLQVGEPQSELHFLLAGQVATTARRFGDVKVPVDVVAPIRPIGLAAALSGQRSIIGARTITSASFLIFPAADLRALLRAEPALAALFLEHALREAQAQTLEICQLKLNSAAQRLAAYLATLAQDIDTIPARFVLPIGMRWLAARIACSPANLARTFGELRSFGVHASHGSVVIEDVSGLRTYAGLD